MDPEKARSVVLSPDSGVAAPWKRQEGDKKKNPLPLPSEVHKEPPCASADLGGGLDTRHQGFSDNPQPSIKPPPSARRLPDRGACCSAGRRPQAWSSVNVVPQRPG